MRSSLFKGLGVIALLIALTLAMAGCDPTPEMVEIKITSTEGGHVEEKVDNEWVTENVETERSVEVGASIQLKAVAEEEYEFAGWEVEGAEHGDLDEEEITLTNFEEGAEITATFEEVVVVPEEYTLDLAKVGEGTIEVDGVEVELPFSEDYEEGTEVTLEAKAAEGYEFKEWEGIEEDDALITVTMDDDLDLTAVFVIIDLLIVGVTDPDPVEVVTGTEIEDIDLPQTVEVTLDDGSSMDADVEWDKDAYDPEILGKQEIVGALINLPEHIKNPDELEATLIIEVLSVKEEYKDLYEEAGHILDAEMDDVEEAKDGLELKTRIETEDAGFGVFNVTWESDNPDVIEIENGVIKLTRPEEDTEVGLTATLRLLEPGAKAAETEDLRKKQYTVKVFAERDVIGVVELDKIMVEVGTDLEYIDFPETVEVNLDDDSTVDLSVVWDKDAYDPEKLGKQEITGELIELPEHINNPDELKAKLIIEVFSVEGKYKELYIEAGDILDENMEDVDNVIEGFELKTRIETEDAGFAIFDVSWESDNPDVIEIENGNAIVTQPQEDTDVVLTATLKLKAMEIEAAGAEDLRKKQYTITVLAPRNIVEVEKVTDEVDAGTEVEDIDFPETVKVTLDDDSIRNINVDWDGVSVPEYDPNQIGEYVFAGELEELPENVYNPEGYAAQFTVEVKGFTLELKDGGGAVEVDGVEVTLPFSKGYPEDKEIVLNAVEEDNWKFVKWVDGDEEEVSQEKELDITMDEDKVFKAVFVKEFVVEFADPENGDLTAAIEDEEEPIPIESGDKVVEGTEVIFTVVPDEFFELVEWKVNEEVQEDEIEEEFTYKVDKDINVEAVLEPIAYSVTFIVEDEEDERLEGAEVKVFADSELEELIDTLTTDEEGEATIDLINDEYWFTAAKEGYEEKTDSFEIEGKEKLITVRLDDPKFTVTFEESSGLEGAEIKVYSDEDRNELVMTAETDNEGKATIYLSEGYYYFTVTKYGYEDFLKEREIDRDVDVFFTMALEERYTVTFQEDNEVEDVTIIVFADADREYQVGEDIITGEDGTVTKELAEGTHWFTASKEGYMDYNDSFEISGEKTVSFALDIIVKDVAAIDDIEVDFGTAFEDIGLPDEVTISFEEGPDKVVPVDWSAAEADYDENTTDTYTLEGELDLPDGVVNPDNLKAEVDVIVGVEPLEVVSVEAINKETLEIEFSKEVKDDQAGEVEFDVTGPEDYEGTATGTIEEGDITVEFSLDPAMNVSGTYELEGIEFEFLAIDQVEAENGLLIVRLKDDLDEAPTAENFTISYSIDEGDDVAVEIEDGDIDWGTGSPHRIDITVDKIERTTENQSVVYTVNDVQADDFTVYFKVVSVEAITERVNINEEDQRLEFTVNDGMEKTLEELDEAGYDIEFLANREVFVDSGYISEDGKLDEDKLDNNVGANETFKYEVEASLEGDVVVSNRQEVLVVDLQELVLEITRMTVYFDEDVENVSGILYENDENVSVKVMGYTESSPDEEVNITGIVELESSDPDVLTVDSNGVITIEISTGFPGEATITATANTLEESVDLTVVEDERIVDPENSEIDTKEITMAIDTEKDVGVTLRDQYGDPVKGEDIDDAKNVKNDATDTIATITATMSDKKGELTITVTADDTEFGEGVLEVRSDTDDVLVGTIHVTVEDLGATEYYVLEIAPGEEDELDLRDDDTNPTTELNLVGYDANDYETERVNFDTTEDVYEFESSDEEIAVIDDVTGEDITIQATGEKTGVVTITVILMDGSLVDEVWEIDIEVIDTRPLITAVDWKDDEIETIEGVAGDPGKIDVDISEYLTAEELTADPDEEIILVNDHDDDDKLNIKTQDDDVVIGSLRAKLVGAFEGESLEFTGIINLELQLGTKATTGTLALRVYDKEGEHVGDSLTGEVNVVPGPVDADNSDVERTSISPTPAAEDNVEVTLWIENEFDIPISGNYDVRVRKGGTEWYNEEVEFDVDGEAIITITVTEAVLHTGVKVEVDCPVEDDWVEIGTFGVRIDPADVDAVESSVERTSDETVVAGDDNVVLDLVIKDEYQNPISGDHNVRVTEDTEGDWFEEDVTFDGDGEATIEISVTDPDVYTDVSVAIEDNGSWVEIGQFDVTVVPEAISDFAATANDETTADFEWTQAVDATNIEIEQQPAGADPEAWASATHDAIGNEDTTAQVTGLDPNTEYDFRLVVTGGQNEGNSNVVTLTTDE